MSQRPVAGWYADPADAQALRWWDGARWTTHRRPRASGGSTVRPTATTAGAAPTATGPRAPGGAAATGAAARPTTSPAHHPGRPGAAPPAAAPRPAAAPAAPPAAPASAGVGHAVAIQSAPAPAQQRPVVQQVAGWYRDPQNPQGLRWWDGSRWTAHARPGPGSTAPAPAPAAGYGRQGAPVARPYAVPPRPAPVRRKRSGAGVALAVVGGAMVTFLVLVLAIAAAVPDVDDDPVAGPTPSAGSTPSNGLWTMADRPGYADLATTTGTTADEYQREQTSGALYDRAKRSADGRRYADAFVEHLLDLRRVVDREATSLDTDPAVLDARIAELSTIATTLETNFLAGAHLGYDVTADGYTVPGDPPDPLTDERTARNYPVAPDGNGSYLPSSIAIADAFDISLTSDYDAIYEHCPSASPKETTAATYCEGSPYVVYFHEGYWDYANFWYHPISVHITRHEIAHHRIHEICGTTGPPIAGDGVEAVTNSYAILYLGASRSRLETNALPGYVTSDWSDDVARAIALEGRCA